MARKKGDGKPRYILQKPGVDCNSRFHTGGEGSVARDGARREGPKVVARRKETRSGSEKCQLAFRRHSMNESRVRLFETEAK